MLRKHRIYNITLVEGGPNSDQSVVTYFGLKVVEIEGPLVRFTFEGGEKVVNTASPNFLMAEAEQ